MNILQTGYKNQRKSSQRTSFHQHSNNRKVEKHDKFTPVTFSEVPQSFIINPYPPFVTMDFIYGECRLRSTCTYVQSDLAPHSPMLYQ